MSSQKVILGNFELFPASGVVLPEGKVAEAAAAPSGDVDDGDTVVFDAGGGGRLSLRYLIALLARLRWLAIAASSGLARFF